MKRAKLYLILAAVLFGALTLIAWTQPWFTLTLSGGKVLTVTGQVAAPALSALGLASLALGAALSIAGKVFRAVLGVVQLLIGVLVAGSAISALSDPIAASLKTVTDAVGESGSGAVTALVTSTASSAWPIISVVLGVLAALVGLAILATMRSWPGPTSKYDTKAEPGVSAAGSWDALSAGQDPT